MNPTTGKHLSFPFRIGKDGRTAQVRTEEEHVRDELVQLILTNLGERVFMSEFGGGVRRLVFENITDATHSVTKAMLTRSISRWLGHRLTLEELVVNTHNETIEVEIKYRIAGTEDRRVMRFERKGA
jgi:phage baseplate assembly protein W